MESKKIKLKEKEINYILKTSRRAKNVRLAIYCDGRVIATKPFWLSERRVEKFILEKAGWITAKLEYFKNHKIEPRVKIKGDYSRHKKEAFNFIKERLEHYNEFYNFKFNKINIKNQKTRWGSCSIKGNLNFNYKILLLPKKIADYIVVHELCHLKEFNHSKRFWDLVSKKIPDYKEARKELKKSGLSLS